MAAVDWSQLPDDLLKRIVENHIISVDDYVMFSCVCHSWYNAVCACHKSKLRHNWTRQMPWLLLSTDQNDDETCIEVTNFCNHMYEDYDNDLCVLEDDEDEFDEFDDEEEQDAFILTTNNVGSGPYRLFVDRNCYRRSMLNLSRHNNSMNYKCYNLSLPEAYGRTCWGSPYGWLLTVGIDYQMFMFNSLTRARLVLPSQDTFMLPRKIARGKTIRTHYIDNLVLLRVPSDGSHGENSNEGTWLVNDTAHPQVLKPYIMDPWLTLHTLRLSYDLHVNDNSRGYYSYIVEYSGDVFIIIRERKTQIKGVNDCSDEYGEFDHYKTTNFIVCKLDTVTNQLEELQDLGDVAFFVANGVTTAVNARDAGCQSNCIYFCDDFRELYAFTSNKVGGHDMGIFKIDDKTIQPFEGINSRSAYCCPLWFSPSICTIPAPSL